MDISLSERKLETYAREQRGQGRGGAYVPGLSFRQISRGVGRMHRFCCARCGGRQIVLRSDADLATFLVEHWDRRTRDLNEYSPLLEIDETLSIAREIGVRHPRMRDGSPSILYTGLLTMKESEDGFSWHASDTLACVGNMERLEPASMHIVREYWQRRGIVWGVNRSLGFNDARICNLWQLFPHGQYLEKEGPTIGEQKLQDSLLAQLRRGRHRTLLEACHAAARANARLPGDGVRAALQLLATHQLEGRLDVQNMLLQPAASLKMAHAAGGH